MANFLSKLFGGKKAKVQNELTDLIESVLNGLISNGGFALDYEVKATLTDADTKAYDVLIELKGDDEELLIEKDGQLLDSFQLLVKRVVQHHLPDTLVDLSFDCNGFRESSNQALVDLAERLRDMALDKGRSVYCRALPPKDRKIVHQVLANDGRVKSRSIGEGVYKKIKIYPAKNGNQSESASKADSI